MKNIDTQNDLSKSRADSWIDNILNSLNNMQVYLDYMTLGAEDIFELFREKSLNVNFSEVQNANLKYFLNESRKLLTNSAKILEDGAEEKIIKLFKDLSDLNKEEEGFTFTRRVNNNGYQTFLKPSFNKARHICNKIREEFVNGLWKLISPKASDISSQIPRH